MMLCGFRGHRVVMGQSRLLTTAPTRRELAENSGSFVISKSLYPQTANSPGFRPEGSAAQLHFTRTRQLPLFVWLPSHHRRHLQPLSRVQRSPGTFAAWGAGAQETAGDVWRVTDTDKADGFRAGRTRNIFIPGRGFPLQTRPPRSLCLVSQ